MNISIDTAVLVIGGFVSASGFIISGVILYRGNKSSFKSLKDHFDSGINTLNTSMSGKFELVALAQKNIENDIHDVNAEINGVKDQLRAEIYPRLNDVEKQAEKNCKVLEYQMKECDRRHKTA